MAASTGTRRLRRPRLISTARASTAGTSTLRTSTAGTSTFWTDTIGTSAIGTSAVEAILDGDPVPLPGTPWSVRPAAGPAGRPAVEIYAAGSMLDVMVAPALAPRVLASPVLRGACALPWAGQPCAVAWGFMPARPGFSVWFTRGPARSRSYAVPVSVIAGWFWVAPAEGRFRVATAEHGGGRDRCRVRAARPC
jgi:hypothetical protein